MTTTISSSRGFVRALRAFVIGSIVTASAATLAQDFSAPVQLNSNNISKPSRSGTSAANAPSLSIDDAGNANAIWAAWVINQSTPYNSNELTWATIGASGGLQSGLVVPALPYPSGTSYAQIKSDALGNSTAIWIQNVESTTAPGTIASTEFYVADRPFGGAWSAPATIPNGVNNLAGAAFSMNSRGDAVLVQNTSYSIRNAGGTWSTFTPFASLADTVDPLSTSVSTSQVIIGENGDVLALWSGNRTYCTRSACRLIPVEMHVARLPAGSQTWLKSGPLPGGVAISLDAEGRAGLLYAAAVGTTTVLRSITQQGAGQPWSTPVDIFTSLPGGALSLQSGNDDAGNVTVVVTDSAYGAATLSITGNLSNNSWTAPSLVGGFGALSDAVLSVGRSGAAVLAGHDMVSTKPSAGSPWGGIVQLGTEGPAGSTTNVEAAAMSASGKAAVVYWKFDSILRVYRLYMVTGTNTGAPLDPATIAPAAPSSLGTYAPSSNLIRLQWTDNASNETAQYLERCMLVGNTACADFAVIATLAPNVITYDDTSVAPATSYYYRIRAGNAAGYSAYSPTAIGGTPAAPVAPLPPAPTGVSATATSATAIALKWTDNATDETAQIVQRCQGAGCTSFVTIATLGANVTTFTDSALTPNTTYSYRVFARNVTGDSSYSATATAVTQTTVVATVPAAPSKLAATAPNRSSVALSWIDNANNELKFKIERCKGTGCTSFSQINTVAANVTTYTDSNNLSRSTTYRYRVRANNATGDSTYSNIAEVKTP